MRIYDLWSKVWDKRIQQQEVMKRITFHNVVGAILPKRGRDLRVNALIISDSGSGKSEAAYLAKEVVIGCGREATVLAEFSTAGLVGSKDRTSQGKEIETESYISTKDWIGIDEADLIFTQKQYTADLLTVLQKSMDPYGVMEKRLKGGSVFVEPKASFFFSSYYLPAIGEAILHRGLFQRMICFVRELTETEASLIEQAIMTKAFAPEDIRVVEDNDLIELTDQLRGIIAWYEEHKITWSEETIEHFRRKYEELKNDLTFGKKSYGRDFQKVQGSFKRRGADLIARLCVHNAISDTSVLVKISHIDEAFNLYRKCFASTITLVMDSIEAGGTPERYVLLTIDALIDVEEMKKTELTKKLMDETESSQTTVIKYLKFVEAREVFFERKEGNVRWVRLNPIYRDAKTRLSDATEDSAEE